MPTPNAPAPARALTLPPALQLKVVYRRPEDLRAYGRKTRSHTRRQIEQITDSIRQFGFITPVLIDADQAVLAGHARLDAARALGLAEVPTVAVEHLSDAEKRAFALADNRLAELAGWDREALKIEFEELSGLDLDFSLDITGFSLPQIDAITFGEPPPREDLAPAPPIAPVNQLGDLWRLGDHRLLCGDALDPANLKRLLGDEKVRTVFTDPPYNVPIGGHVTSSRRHGEFVAASGEMTDDQFTVFLAGVWAQVERALVDGGLAYLCMDWRHMRHVLEAADATALELRNLIVWDKTAGGMGSFYRSRHELIFLMRKAGAGHINMVELGKHGRDRANVWAYAGVNGFGADKAKARDMHPTVKPLDLVKDAILDSSRRGEIVLDLFNGSGTTLIAAERTHRQGRAFELDPRYVDVAIERWEAISGREAVLVETGETFRAARARRAASIPDIPSPAPPARPRVRPMREAA